MASLGSKTNSARSDKASTAGKPKVVNDLNMTKTVNDGMTVAASGRSAAAQTGFEEGITDDENLGLRGGDGGAGGPGAYCLVM